MAGDSFDGGPGSDREPAVRLDAELQLFAGGDDERGSAAARKFAERLHIYNESPSADSHQRAEMVTDLLSAAEKVDVEKAIEIAFSTQVWHAETWQARIKDAWRGASDSDKSGDAAQVFELIGAWDRYSAPDSTGALRTMHSNRRWAAARPV